MSFTHITSKLNFFVAVASFQIQSAETRGHMKYILALDPDKPLAPFLREGGITPKAESYGNWEGSGLDVHIGDIIFRRFR